MLKVSLPNIFYQKTNPRLDQNCTVTCGRALQRLYYDARIPAGVAPWRRRHVVTCRSVTLRDTMTLQTPVIFTAFIQIISCFIQLKTL